MTLRYLYIMYIIYRNGWLVINTGTRLPIIVLGLGLKVHFTIGFYFRGVEGGVLQLQHFLWQLSSETFVEYILAKFVDAETISSSVMSGYSHKNLNVLFICLAALNLVLSPA